MNPITKGDLILINELSARKYTGNTLSSNASDEEKMAMQSVKAKLKGIAAYFKDKYDDDYGPFITGISDGNPLAIGGTTFKRVWSGIFKGAGNKQYAAQISFVMNPQEAFLEVGFYFGRASGHSFTKEQKKEYETGLKALGTSLGEAIDNDPKFNANFNALFDTGFTPFADKRVMLPEEWIRAIRKNPSNSQIIAKVYPNDFGVIENSTIDYYVSQVIFLMSGIPDVQNSRASRIIKPLSPEQRAKQAERFSQIGLKGELYVMAIEKIKVIRLHGTKTGYPKHVALESMHYGYDILSLDETGKECCIEVKTTTRQKDDPMANSFFLSNNELDFFIKNKNKHQIHRVYDIENNPSVEILNLETLVRIADGYIVTY